MTMPDQSPTRTVLEHARHALVCTEGLRATDLSEEQIAALVANGRSRSDLEFTIEHTAILAQIDALLAQEGEV